MNKILCDQLILETLEQHVSYFKTTLLTIHHLNHRSLVLRNTSVKDSFCLKVNMLQNVSSDK